MTAAQAILRILNDALAQHAADAGPCACDGPTVCRACAAVAALERLGEIEAVVGMMDRARNEETPPR